MECYMKNEVNGLQRQLICCVMSWFP